MPPRFLLLVLLLTFSCISCTTYSQPKNSIHWTECGFEIGDHACDFSLIAQNGQPWNLYHHYGSVVVLDFSTTWCYPCQLAARSIPSVVSEKSELVNFNYVTILLQDNQGNSPPPLNILEIWALRFSINSPVLAGDRVLANSNAWNVSNLPTFYILNKDLIIVDILVGYNEQALNRSINSAIESF